MTTLRLTIALIAGAAAVLACGGDASSPSPRYSLVLNPARALVREGASVTLAMTASANGLPDRQVQLVRSTINDTLVARANGLTVLGRKEGATTIRVVATLDRDTLTAQGEVTVFSATPR